MKIPNAIFSRILLIQKLLLNQSEIDSIQVTDSQVEGELDNRMKYFVNAMGSEEKLEDYFKKTVLEIKEDLRDEIRQLLLTNSMRSKITEGLTVTPSEVRNYFKSLPTRIVCPTSMLRLNITRYSFTPDQTSKPLLMSVKSCWVSVKGS